MSMNFLTQDMRNRMDKIKRKPRPVTINGITYDMSGSEIDARNNGISDMNEFYKKRDAYLKRLQIEICELYLADLPIIKGDNVASKLINEAKALMVDLHVNDNIVIIPESIISNFKRCTRHLHNIDGKTPIIKFRIEGGSDIWSFGIYKGVDKDPSIKTSVSAYVLDYDLKRKAVIFYEYVFGEKDGKFLISSKLFSPLVIGLKEKDANNFFPDYYEISKNMEIFMLMLKVSFDMYCDLTNYDRNWEERSLETIHNPFELKIIRRMISRETSNGDNSYILTVGSWKFDDNPASEKFINNRDVPKETRYYDPLAPLIDFSDKEMKFIEKYILEKKIMGKEDGEYDFAEVLKNPRYGTKFMINGKMNEVNDVKAHFYYTYNENTDIARFYLSFDLEGYTAILGILIENCRNFNFSRSIRDVKSLLAIDSYKDDSYRLYESEKSINENLMPPIGTDPLKILSVMYDIISILIVMYERPKKNRLITVTENKPKAKSSKSSKNETEQVVIKRILKTATAAKEYVKKMSSIPSERIYTMESWEREGHYRRKPHSQETIWIKETTCYRKKELTKDDTREIKIKL